MNVYERVQQAARDAAAGVLDPASIRDIRVEPAVGSDGQDILRIMVVLTDDADDALAGDKVISTIVSIRQRIRETGEDRPAIVEYATVSELDDDGDPEP